MSEYINREDALNLDFRINVNMFESRLKTAERAVQAYADAIDKILAADVRPVVRGKWRPHKTKTWKNWWKCSACDYVSEHKAHHNYCPNCGADMREES